LNGYVACPRTRLARNAVQYKRWTNVGVLIGGALRDIVCGIWGSPDVMFLSRHIGVYSLAGGTPLGASRVPWQPEDWPRQADGRSCLPSPLCTK
jgi:hypothetical protein